MIRQNGFTLIELVLVVALMAISVGVTSDILVNLIRSYNKTTITTEIEQNANFLSQKLIKELRNSTRITALDPADATPLQVGDSHNAISFLSKSGSTITYSISGGIASRNIGAGLQPLTQNAPPLGINISCISGNACFTMLENDPQVIQISLLITQSGTPANLVFQGSLKIEDTVVIRNTY